MTVTDRYEVSYSQNREDIIIAQFFKHDIAGFYIDVGANDPVEDSVTLYFYKRGWNGINIEPNQELYKKLKHERRKDINLNVGVADKDGKLTLRRYRNHGLSTFSEAVKQEHKEFTSNKTDEYEDISVPVKRLDEILAEAKAPKNIQFMKVDVEGFEYEVLSGADFTKNRPELICIESNHIKKDWRPILRRAKYQQVFFDGINDYYLAEESLHRLKDFDYAEAFLLGKPIISPGIEHQLATLEVVEKEASVNRNRITALENQYEQVLRQRNELFLQLQRFQGFRRQARTLLATTYERLYSRAEQVAYVKSYVYPKQKVRLSGNRKKLLDNIRAYDRQVLSERRIVGPKSRRASSKLLKGGLRVPKDTARLMKQGVDRVKVKRVSK